jgi:acetolactate synthase small subunit
MSKGEQRVRTTFNPNNDSVVEQIKQKTAELINLIDLMSTNDAEVNRLKALAQTSYEEAAMWAVKAATA